MVTSTVEKLSPTRVKLHISVTPDELKPSIAHAYEHIAQDIQHLFLVVPNSNWTGVGGAREKPYPRVLNRVGAFFGTPRREVDVLARVYAETNREAEDALRAAQILLREGPKAIEANTEAMRKQGEASRVARERLDSLQGAQKKFAAAMEQARI